MVCVVVSGSARSPRRPVFHLPDRAERQPAATLAACQKICCFWRTPPNRSGPFRSRRWRGAVMVVEPPANDPAVEWEDEFRRAARKYINATLRMTLRDERARCVMASRRLRFSFGSTATAELYTPVARTRRRAEKVNCSRSCPLQGSAPACCQGDAAIDVSKAR
jgi:hypothetical protein